MRRGGNAIREHMGALVKTVVNAKVFSILTGDEHLVGVSAGKAGTVARNGENTARQTAARSEAIALHSSGIAEDNYLVHTEDKQVGCQWKDFLGVITVF